MKRIICLSILVAWATLTFAQSHGSLHVDQDSRIESLIAKQRSLERAFPDIPIYLTYVEPHFLLRAGDFRNRVEAEKCLRQIKPKFKEAFVTADKIYRPKVSLYKNEE